MNICKSDIYFIIVIILIIFVYYNLNTKINIKEPFTEQNVIKLGSWILYDNNGRFVIKRNDNAVKYVFHNNKITANVTQGTNNDRSFTYYVTAMADRQPFHTTSNEFGNI